MNIEKVFQDVLLRMVEVYRPLYRNHGLPYITHLMEVASGVTSISEKVLALIHDFCEFRSSSELADLGVPPELIAKAQILAKLSPYIQEEDSQVYRDYIWNILSDEQCRRVKYFDLSTNATFEESPLVIDREERKKCAKTLALLTDAREGKLYFKSRSFLVNVFSNFYPEEIIVNGESWKSGEHFYQAAKFSRKYGIAADDKVYEAIKNAQTSMEAKEIADASFSDSEKSRWATAARRYAAMAVMLNAKFAKGTKAREYLDKTAGLELIHESRTDMYWGQNRNGEGENCLGKGLMSIRDEDAEFPILTLMNVT